MKPFLKIGLVLAAGLVAWQRYGDRLLNLRWSSFDPDPPAGTPPAAPPPPPVSPPAAPPAAPPPPPVSTPEPAPAPVTGLALTLAMAGVAKAAIDAGAVKVNTDRLTYDQWNYFYHQARGRYAPAWELVFPETANRGELLTLPQFFGAVGAATRGQY